MENQITQEKLDSTRFSFEHEEGTEDVKKREEYVKHFDLGENRYQAIVFPEPVHFRDAGKDGWLEIDNNLDEACDEAGRKVWRNRANALHAQLLQTADNRDLISLTNVSHTISWAFEGDINPVIAEVHNGEALLQAEKAHSKFSDNDQGEAPIKTSDLPDAVEERRCDRTGSMSEVLYENILRGVSVRYTISGDQVKENITLSDADAVNRAVVKLPFDYEYCVSADKRISVVDRKTNAVAFSFGVPFVYDSVGNVTVADIQLMPEADYMSLRYNLDSDFLSRAVYPVTIDPVVKARASSESTTWMVINNGTPDVAGTTSGDLKIGTNGSEYASLLRFNNLVRIKSSDTITSAKLKLSVNNSGKKKYVGAYEVLSEWGTSDTWNSIFNSVTVGEDVLDYAEGDKSTVTLNLTNLYRQWYRTDEAANLLNYGVLLKCPEGFDKYQTFYSPGNSTKANRPLFTVNYISHAGMAPWCQYESQSAGRAGTMYVDLFNGNVVYAHPDTAMNGSRMPVSIAHYYNSCLSDDNMYRCGHGWKHTGLQRVYQKKLSSKDYYVWVDGTGTEHWFRNLGDNNEVLDLEGLQMRLTRYGATSTRVPRIEIVDKNHTTMTFQRRESLKFDGKWNDYWLMKIEDSTDSEVVYKYAMPDDAGKKSSKEMQKTEGKLLSITDGAGRVTEFTYNEGNLLSSISIPGVEADEKRTMSFNYTGCGSSIVLSGIQYPDLSLEGQHTVFRYDENTNLLLWARNFDGQCVRASYETCGGTTYEIADENVNENGETVTADGEVEYVVSPQMRRAFSLERCSANESESEEATDGLVVSENGYGAKVLLTYKNMCTVVTTLNGTVADPDNDKSLTYQFNDSGNVLSVHDELGFAQFTKYDSGISNAPSDVSRLRCAVVNRLRDVQFFGIGGTASVWAATNDTNQETGVKAGTCEITHKTACLNCPSLMLSRVLNDTYNLYYSQNTTVERSQGNDERYYTFSVYVKADSIEGNGAFIRVRNGSETVNESTHIVGSTEAMLGNELPTDGWERLSVVFQAPEMAGQTSIDLLFDLVHGGTSGTVYFACPQLEEGKVANPVNLISNSDFRATWVNAAGNLTRNFPCDWEASSDIVSDMAVGVFTKDTDPVSNNSYDPMPGFLKGGFLQLVGTPQYKSTSSNFSQVLEMKGKAGDVYFAGCWNSSKCVPGSTGDVRGYRVSVRFYDEKKDKWREGAQSKIHINGEWVGWQMTGGAVCATSEYSKVRVFLVYRGNPNRARFTNVFLHREQFGQSFSYDKHKNVTDTTTLAGQTARMEYDPQFNLISYCKPGRSNKKEFKYTMSYGDSTAKRKTHLLRSSKTPMGVRRKFEYDKYGNQTSSVLQKKDGEAFIKMATAYDADKNYPVSRTDARGNDIYMRSNPRTGMLTFAVNPMGANINYAYDASSRLTSVNCCTGEIEGEGEGAHDYRRLYQNDYAYEDDRLKTASHNTAFTMDEEDELHPSGSVVYSFEYDQLGAQTSVSVGEGVGARTLSANTYSNDRIHKLTSVEYGNGGQVSYVYDEFDRLTEMNYETDDPENPVRYTYEYGADGQVAYLADHNLNRTHWTEYDLAQRPKRATTRDGATGETVYQTTLKYDKLNHLVSFGERVGDGESELKRETKYTYDNDDRTAVIQYDDDKHTVRYDYDDLGRVKGKTIVNGTAGDTVSYTFVSGSGKKATTPLVASIKHSGIKEGTAKSTSLDFAYTYDDAGSILSETRGGVTTAYWYDILGQLTGVSDPHDKSGGADGTIWVYEYDCGGSILEKRKYARLSDDSQGELLDTIHYTYGDAGWKDLLTNFNNSPNDITYDGIGNPLIYDGWTYEWQAGRQLRKMLKGTEQTVTNAQGKTVQKLVSGERVEFAYDAAGLRILKKHSTVTNQGSPTAVEVVTTDYTLHGKLVTHLKQATANDTVDANGNVTASVEASSNQLHFFYDAQSRPAMVSFNGLLYAYVHNLQGDIVAILDSTGTKVVEYKYDAWGKPLTGFPTGTLKDTLGKLNPFRYRGYVYDMETALYYLRSRCYCPEWGRFVNEDSLIGKTGKLLNHNIFAYCRNNPVCEIDPSGAMQVDWYMEQKLKRTINRIKERGGVAVNRHVNYEDRIYYLTSDQAKEQLLIMFDQQNQATPFSETMADELVSQVGGAVASKFFGLSSYGLIIGLDLTINAHEEQAKETRRKFKEAADAGKGVRVYTQVDVGSPLGYSSVQVDVYLDVSTDVWDSKDSFTLPPDSGDMDDYTFFVF